MKPEPMQPKKDDGYAFLHASKEPQEQEPEFKPEPQKDPWIRIDNDRLFHPWRYVRYGP